MKIEMLKQYEVDTITEIWYRGSVQSHSFIDSNYWLAQKQEMRDKYIPMAQSYVIYHENEVAGFVSMVDNYLAALFIDPVYQGNGYGRELLQFIKGKYSTISLKVYKENKSAIRFYEKNGFLIKETLLDENTGHGEYLMEWC
ncbi:N-acetyltransferase [Sutcliffiella rhizosphaerae]|uniref:Peptidyl-lysine N-acetyltransferase YiaC n=1 Tax=Sutcliffiella rhizosphaerae TaxID=2880967 RepID=A0ABM8YKR3_9BACI|nr:N-acetyltransferase [Sutcliffiella rhizosphaerae]CAG9620383.1 Peptidyl-lysine N-acetyltransferase YiaC [Sutcliffiella rhizosphaerae]